MIIILHQTSHKINFIPYLTLFEIVLSQSIFYESWYIDYTAENYSVLSSMYRYHINSATVLDFKLHFQVILFNILLDLWQIIQNIFYSFSNMRNKVGRLLYCISIVFVIVVRWIPKCYSFFVFEDNALKLATHMYAVLIFIQKFNV